MTRNNEENPLVSWPETATAVGARLDDGRVRLVHPTGWRIRSGWSSGKARLLRMRTIIGNV